jgi:anti-anti-sigma factor
MSTSEEPRPGRTTLSRGPWWSERDRTLARSLVGDLSFHDKVEDGRVVVVVRGDVDGFSCDRLSRELLVAASGPHAIDATIVLDLTDVAFIDSSGLRAILVSKTRLEMRGQKLVLRAPSPEVLRAIDASGVRELFGIEPS